MPNPLRYRVRNVVPSPRLSPRQAAPLCCCRDMNMCCARQRSGRDRRPTLVASGVEAPSVYPRNASVAAILCKRGFIMSLTTPSASGTRAYLRPCPGLVSSADDLNRLRRHRPIHDVPSALLYDSSNTKDSGIKSHLPQTCNMLNIRGDQCAILAWNRDIAISTQGVCTF